MKSSDEVYFHSGNSLQRIRMDQAVSNHHYSDGGGGLKMSLCSRF
jgi:hypothetical protein